MGDFSSVIFNAELIQCRVFTKKNLYGSGIAVLHNVCQRFFYNTDKTVFDIAGDLSGNIVSEGYRAESKALDQALRGMFQIDGFVMQIMYTGTDAVHCRVQ